MKKRAAFPEAKPSLVQFGLGGSQFYKLISLSYFCGGKLIPFLH